MATNKTQKHPPSSPFLGSDDRVLRDSGQCGGACHSSQQESPHPLASTGPPDGLAPARPCHCLRGKPGEASGKAWWEGGPAHSDLPCAWCRVDPEQVPGRRRLALLLQNGRPAFMPRGKAQLPGTWLAPPAAGTTKTIHSSRQTPTEWVPEAWPPRLPHPSSISSQVPQDDFPAHQAPAQSRCLSE